MKENASWLSFLCFMIDNCEQNGSGAYHMKAMEDLQLKYTFY